jgi:hypothetical protein
VEGGVENSGILGFENEIHVFDLYLIICLGFMLLALSLNND